MITKRFTFGVISVLLVLQIMACSPSAQNVEGEKWVSFSGKQAEKLNIPKSYIEPEGMFEYWSPAESDVNAIENGLASYLQENSDGSSSEGEHVWERLDEYNRQYIGVIIDGQNIVFANFFCDSAGLDWRNKFVIVLDGGDCFFQFKYNMVEGVFFDLWINGSA